VPLLMVGGLVVGAGLFLGAVELINTLIGFSIRDVMAGWMLSPVALVTWPNVFSAAC
jgi:hypothetical protein